MSAPVACTLSAGAFKMRMAEIADLNRDALRGQERDDLTLVLTYAPEALARVRDMVRREQECCAFLDFAITEDTDGVRLRITAPEEARIAAETLFADFAKEGAASGCACCS